jgi:hypothetical protein
VAEWTYQAKLHRGQPAGLVFNIDKLSQNYAIGSMPRAVLEDEDNCRLEGLLDGAHFIVEGD